MRNETIRITIHGNSKVWCFEVQAEPEWVDDWRKDGLEVDEVICTIGGAED